MPWSLCGTQCGRYTGVEILSADTSYGDPADKALGRGASLAGVSIVGASLEVNHAVVFGTLADGLEHEAHLATLHAKGPAHDAKGDDEYVGIELDDGWWVKARVRERGGEGVAGRRRYICNRGSGRTTERCEHLVEEL